MSADPGEEYPVAVSILMPAYEATATLGDAVASVRVQSFGDWELLIVDDGSRDGTHGVAAEAARQDARIRVLRHPENRGAAAARNSGLAAARGRRIAFLDADDLWMPEKLARQIAFMETSGAALSYTGFRRERLDGSGSGRVVEVPASVTRADLLRGNVIGCLTACYDRAHLGDMPMPPLRLRQDFALWLDILSRVERAWGLTEPLAIHRVRRDSLSSGRLEAAAATWTMYRGHLGLSRARTSWYLGSHLIRRALRG